MHLPRERTLHYHKTLPASWLSVCSWPPTSHRHTMLLVCSPGQPGLLWAVCGSTEEDKRLSSPLQLTTASSPFSLPQPHHCCAHPAWSLLINRKHQTSCSQSIQEVTAKSYSRNYINYIRWMRREKGIPLKAWPDFLSISIKFSKLF